MTLFLRRCVALLAFLCCSAGAAQASDMVSVAGAEVNMRSGPGTRHEAVWALARGYPLVVVGRQGKWLKVRDFENDQGWVYRSLTDRTPHHIVKAPVANLRRTPSTRATIVGKALYGDVLRTLDRRGQWIKVRHEAGITGWIATRLVWGW